MHWLIHWIVDPKSIDKVLYVGLSTGVGVLFVLILHAILYLIISSALSDEDHWNKFEYVLRRNWLKSILYLLIAFLLSAEIITSWKMGWLEGWFYMIPLWAIFLFTVIMAIVKGSPFMRRAGFLLEYHKKFNTIWRS